MIAALRRSSSLATRTVASALIPRFGSVASAVGGLPTARRSLFQGELISAFFSTGIPSGRKRSKNITFFVKKEGDPGSWKVQLPIAADVSDLKRLIKAEFPSLKDVDPNAITLHKIEADRSLSPSLDSTMLIKDAVLQEREQLIFKVLASASASAAHSDDGALQAIKEFLAKLTMSHHSMTDISVSRTTTGETVRASLEAANAIEVFAGHPGEPAILTEQQQVTLQTAAADGTKHHVVAYMTPILQGLLAKHNDALPQVLVNSECHEWLLKTDLKAKLDKRQHSSPLKPDLFLTYSPFCLCKPRSTVTQFPGGHFGILSSRALHHDKGVLGVLVAKKGKGSLTDGDFGDLVSFLMCFSYNIWGMLFSEQELWLCNVQMGMPVRLVKSKWTTPGSKRMLQEFVAERRVTPPVAALLQTALAHHGLQLLQLERPAGKSCHLGSGASGHVFAVTRGGAAEPKSPLALKISVRSAQLVREYQALRKAALAGAPVIPVVPYSFVHLEGGHSGFYLLAAVGDPCPAERPKWLCETAFAALQRLHAAGCFHGDARLANLLLLQPAVGAAADGLDAGAPGKQAFWIDIANSAELSLITAREAQSFRREDAACLAASILCCTELPPDVASCVKAYDIAQQGSVDALVASVWAAVKVRGLHK